MTICSSVKCTLFENSPTTANCIPDVELLNSEEMCSTYSPTKNFGDLNGDSKVKAFGK